MKARYGKRKRQWQPACGTPAGYAAHLKKHQRPCPRCLIGSETYSDEEIQNLALDFHHWSKNQHLWKTYQLSVERFAQIFAEQGSRCACCSTTDPGDASWHLDHDHQTNAIRGILCSNCNTGIGQLGDNLEGLQRAVAYLQAHNAKGSHARAQNAPPQQHPRPKISAVMRRCFELFKQGVPPDRAVIIMHLTPDAVAEIHALWNNGGGEVDRVSRHVFQIATDPPSRFTCSCGYAAFWTNPTEMQAAVERLNTHISEANGDREIEWNLLKDEELVRRLKAEQRRKSERRKDVIEKLQPRVRPTLGSSARTKG